jgi:uncharacterized tellurite resistance protein B-like protein
MFGSLKALISGLLDEPRAQNPSGSKDWVLAAAALLVRASTIDSEMSQARRTKLHAVLKARFQRDDLAVSRLIEAADAANRAAVDLYHFTRQLNNAIGDEDRRQIIKMMWEVIYADGKVNELESNIVWRVADLLGVSSRQRIELRQCVAAGESGIFLAAHQAASS